jgi:hypothetical protein
MDGRHEGGHDDWGDISQPKTALARHESRRYDPPLKNHPGEDNHEPTHRLGER